MSKETLKQQIDLDINTNGLQQITGEKLNNVLNDIVDEMAIGGGVIEEGNTQAVSGGEVFEAIEPIDNVLFKTISKGTDFISELVGSDINNTELWDVGFLTVTGAVNTSEKWRHSKKFYKIEGDLLDFNFGVYGNGAICFYDKEFQFLEGILKGSTVQTTYFTAENYTKPENAVYCRLSHFIANFSTSNIYIKNSEKIFNTKSDVFLKSEDTPEFINEELYKYGVSFFPIGTQFISELVGSDINNTELWGDGYFIDNGVVQSSSTWKYTKKKYKLLAGNYEIKVALRLGSRALILNLDGSVRKSLAPTISPYGQTFYENIESDAYFVTSQPTPSGELPTTSRLSVVNTEAIYPVVITNDNINDFVVPSLEGIRHVYKDTYRPKIRRPLVTLISDDGRIQNDDWYIQILDEFKVKSTFAIVGNWTKEVDEGTRTNAFGSDRLRELFNEGHDIASHTWTHTSQWNVNLTMEQIEEEMSRTKVYLESIVSTPVNMFISPYGIRNAGIDNIISKYYDANFISGFASTNNVPLDNYFVNRVKFDCEEDNFQLQWDTILKPAIDETILNNNWLVFAVHPQYNQYYTNNPNYIARREELRTLLQYCKDNGIEVVTAKKGYEYYKNFVNIGVRRYDSKVYQLGMDGTEYNLNYFE